MASPQNKLKIILPDDPAIPLLGIYPPKIKSKGNCIIIQQQPR
jgi:hypothetical protein